MLLVEKNVNKNDLPCVSLRFTGRQISESNTRSNGFKSTPEPQRHQNNASKTQGKSFLFTFFSTRGV